MRKVKQVAGGALVTALLTSAVWAQGLRQPQSVRQTAYDNYYTLEEEASGSPSDTEAAELEPLAAYDEGFGGCGPVSGCGKCGGGCQSASPWTMPQLCTLQQMGIRMGGWLQQGITFNGSNPADGFNGPVATNDWDGEYQMNQFWLYLDRPADNGGCGWAVGGHVDMLYGSDWRFGINHGLEDRINSFDNSYGIAIPQAYVEVAWNRLSVKLGHFAGILDYEVVPAVANPFYSHSYSYSYTVPQLVTGALVDYELTEQFSIQAGFTRGWFMFEDFNHHLDFMGGVKWVSSDKQTTLAYAINIGPQDRIAGDQERFSSSFVLAHQFTQRLKYVLVHNLGVEDDAVAQTGEDGEWYGLNQYFLYTLNPCWQVNCRVEWLRDDDGTRVVGVAGPGSPFPVRAYNGSGFAGDFCALSLGLNWRPHPNLVFRPEVRWDWYSGLPGANARLPFDDGGSNNQVLFGVDAIVTF